MKEVKVIEPSFVLKKRKFINNLNIDYSKEKYYFNLEEIKSKKKKLNRKQKKKIKEFLQIENKFAGDNPIYIYILTIPFLDDFKTELSTLKQNPFKSVLAFIYFFKSLIFSLYFILITCCFSLPAIVVIFFYFLLNFFFKRTTKYQNLIMNIYKIIIILAGISFFGALAIINPALALITALVFNNLGKKHIIKNNWQSIKIIGKFIILLLGLISIVNLIELFADYLLFK